MSIFDNTKALVAVGATAGVALFSAGSVAGYFYAKRKIVAAFDEMLQEEVQKTREYYKGRYKRLNKVEEFATPEEAAQHLGLENAAAEALASYRPSEGVVISDATILETEAVLEEQKTDRGKNVVHYNGVAVDPVTGDIQGPAPVADNEPIRRNVFSEPPTTDVDFAYADEIKGRTKSRPYIISQEEWEDNDPSHEQVEMTYYEGDKTISDPNDKPVALVDETIGWDNLRFGHRSNDNDVVYVRHETYTLDMMIVRDERKYGEHVGGFVQGTGLR